MCFLLGYCHKTLGVVSECPLSTLSSVTPLSTTNRTSSYYEIEVVGSLPQINVSTSLPKVQRFVTSKQSDIVCSAVATLYTGQRYMLHGGLFVTIVSIKEHAKIILYHGWLLCFDFL